MRAKMIFKFGVTVVIAVAVVIVYVRHTDPDDQLGKQSDAEKEHARQTQGEIISDQVVAGEDEKKPDIPSKSQTKSKSEFKQKNSEENINKPKILENKNVKNFDGQKAKENIDLKKGKPEKMEINQEKSAKVGQNVLDNIEKDGKDKDEFKAVFSSSSNPPEDSIHLSLVACGDRMEESLVLFKSAVLFTKKHLIFHIFADSELQKPFKAKIDFWPEKFLSRVDYFIYNITFPKENTDQWSKLFKPCASQRLFIPVLLTSVDSLIYVDTDILFLRPLDDLWSFFDQFNSSQVGALAPEHEDSSAGWYNRFARHPYYGKLGVNSGVFLMNLTRLRSSPWMSSMLEYYKEYKLKIAWGDQDLINIYFHFYPEQLYVYGCEWNYRPDHCMYMSVCKQAEVEGISVLHGSRRVMHNDKQPTFRALYQAFRDHRLGDDVQFRLLVQIERNLKETENTRCGKYRHMFIKQIETFCMKKRAAEEKARMENVQNISKEKDENLVKKKENIQTQKSKENILSSDDIPKKENVVKKSKR